MAERTEAIELFLAHHGWAGAERATLADDASFRRYERLRRGDETIVLMDAPPPQEYVGPFVAMAGHLRSLGYSAPAVEAKDVRTGLLLLEDLGDATFSRALQEGADAALLYGAAIDLLADLHRRNPPPIVASYDEAEYLAEADLLLDWFLPAMTGRQTATTVRSDYRAAWRDVLPSADLGPEVLVLRDYHADNLMWLPTRTGHARVGLLDFQDALAGSPAYDVVSLLEDVRRPVSQQLVESMIARYLAAGGGLDAARFRDAYAVLGGQRNAKIVGIFTRLWRRDGKPSYLDLIPEAWRLLEQDLSQTALAPVRTWFDKYVPRELRCAPAS